MNNDRDDHRTRLIKNGRLACVSTLDEWPRTQHERRTFTVDLTIFNVSIGFWFKEEFQERFNVFGNTSSQSSMMVFTVTGLFKEFSGESSTPASMQSYDLRHFARTFVVVPQNTGYCIRNETIFLTNATHEQTREFKRSQHQPAPGAVASTSAASTSSMQGSMPSISSSSLQNRLNQGQAPGQVVAILPPGPSAVASGSAAMGAAGLPQDDATKMQMVQAMSAQSQMNLDWSRK